MTLVLTEDHGAVRHVVLNRPEKRNAFNGELVVATGEALRGGGRRSGGALRRDPRRRPDVLLRHGPRRAGRPRRRRPSTCARSARRCLDAWNLAEEMTKPTICQIHGACIGGAMELALACDLRVIAADALVGMPETRIGLIPDVGGSSRLPAVVGLGRAKELIMTGKLIGGEEAERIGLANRVAPADELDDGDRRRWSTSCWPARRWRSAWPSA